MSGNVEIRHLRAFVAVAEELHFTRAAARVHVVQQTLSEQIRQLERELGTKLVHRTTRKVELTPAGEVFLGHARNLIDGLEGAIADAARTGSGHEGRLRISYTPTLRTETLPILVTGIRERAPEIKITTAETWPLEGIHGVANGLFDATLVRHPEITRDLSAHLLREEPLGVVLGRAHPSAHKDAISVDDVASDLIAMWPRELSPGYYKLVEDLFPEHFLTERVYEFEHFTRDGLLSDPAAHAGIKAGDAFQPAFETQYASIPEDFVWRPLEPAPLIGLHIVIRAGPTSPTLNRLLELAQEIGAEQGWLSEATTQS